MQEKITLFAGWWTDYIFSDLKNSYDKLYLNWKTFESAKDVPVLFIEII